VAGVVSVQPSQSRPQGLSPVSFIMVVGHEGVWVVSWFLGKGEGEIDTAKKWKKNLLPLPFFVRGRRRYTVPFKTTLF